MGYVAHEFAHGAFLHHIRGFYAEAKERRKNKLLGGITAGLNTIAAYMAAVTGNKCDNTPYIESNEKN